MQIPVLILFLILGIWLTSISLVLYKIFALFNKLTKGVGEADLKKVLEHVISKEEANEIKISDLAKRTNWLEEDGRAHIQKLGLVRFNPFKELGGDHSFSLAILNAEDDGIIVTSLHTRDRTRVYMKDIKNAKSSFELSNDEIKALNIAKKQK